MLGLVPNDLSDADVVSQFLRRSSLGSGFLLGVDVVVVGNPLALLLAIKMFEIESTSYSIVRELKAWKLMDKRNCCY